MISPTRNENAMMQAVSLAPTVIYFDAENSFMLYSGGIYAGGDCSGSINHASEWSVMIPPSNQVAADLCANQAQSGALCPPSLKAFHIPRIANTSCRPKACASLQLRPSATAGAGPRHPPTGSSRIAVSEPEWLLGLGLAARSCFVNAWGATFLGGDAGPLAEAWRGPQYVYGGGTTRTVIAWPRGLLCLS